MFRTLLFLWATKKKGHGSFTYRSNSSNITREGSYGKETDRDAACKMHLIIYYGFGRCLGLICLSTCLRILCVFTLEECKVHTSWRVGSGEFWEVIKAFTLEAFWKFHFFEFQKMQLKFCDSTPVRSFSKWEILKFQAANKSQLWPA